MRTMLLGLMATVMMVGPALADDRRGRSDDRGDDRRYEQRDDLREWRDDRRDDRRDSLNDFRRDNRRDWYGDRRYWRPVGRSEWRWAGPRHRAPGYALPRGYRYRPFAVGYRAPPAFFARPYWVANPRFFRLPPAYRGTRWVRYGPDALLIQLGNGVVVQAVRGVWF